MIDGLSILAIVPARGGSKGLPRKNIRELAGKPLIAWTLDAARDSRYVDRCIVSTDDDEIAAVARAHGGDVPFLRPPELAGDDANTHDAIVHALSLLPAFDILVLLQPTSPLRGSEDIDGTLETLLRHRAPSCVSVVEPAKSPYWSYRVDAHQRLQPLLDPQYSRMRRQDLPHAFVLNGAVYAAHTAWLIDNGGALGDGTVPYVMPPERSVDIDTAFDFELAALYLRHHRQSSAA
ncbi:MAG: acylneuraminate cytidylyltransferase family protein [Chromatiaceae bacterium]|nr:acylneuraminate cytidylyltransferase family protein [Gammaproteobacteria bacterium]MCP5301042.1 acylneuraminate cytidylyltransferase family protein [Chromatiaceae bacterium]MCP5421486.1 acylneuraminate cytidylyltransferase family protein [Chromatiaceae bacterium]